MEFKAEGGVTVTDDMLNTWADAIDAHGYNCILQPKEVLKCRLETRKLENCSIPA